MSSKLVVQNFINGQFESTSETLDGFEPATGEVYSQIPNSSEEDVQRAFLSAQKAFSSWSKTTREERSKLLLKIADLIEKDLTLFAEAESKDTGKSITFASTVDIPRSVYNFRFFANAILHHEEMSTDVDGVAINYTVRQPIGVVGLISPWNLPLYLLTWKIAPALATGNTVVCKPSELSPVTAWMLCRVLNEAGLPHGVVNMVHGLGSICGNAIVSHPKIKMISFTGGTKTARTIIAASASNYKKLSLELGGKNANLIFDDANLDTVIPNTIRSSFANQGEICLCGSRIYVQEGIYDAFLTRFVEETKKLKVGNPYEKDTNVGALICKAHFDKVKSYIDKATELGGVVHHGGVVDTQTLPETFKNGYFILPTVITGLTQDCPVVQEEIFGPVVTILPFKTEEEAIELANDVEYGLSCSVWTENSSRTHRVALAIQAGTVWVNTWMLRDLRVPFGGMKSSGIGREGGIHSIDAFTEQKTICIRYDQK